MKRIGYLIVALTVALAASPQEPQAALSTAPEWPETAPTCVAARFQHETCTFCPGGDVTIEDWTKIRPPDKGNAVLTAGSYIGPASRSPRANTRAWNSSAWTSPAGVFGGSSRAWSTEETFNHFHRPSCWKSLKRGDAGRRCLPGAARRDAAVRNVPRPEAEIARRFREIVGPDVPIVGSFDLHANEDEEFLRLREHARS